MREPKEKKTSEEFDLPVKPYVSKYLSVQLSGEPLDTSWRHSFGIFIHQMLQNQIERKDYNKQLKNYTSTYPLVISQYHMFHHGARNLNSCTIVRANNLLESEFRRELYSEVNFQVTYKKEREKKAIHMFLEKYSMTEDDISYDAILKSWRRVKTERKDKSVFFWIFS